MTQYFRNPRFDFDAEQSVLAAFRGVQYVQELSHNCCGGEGVCGAFLAACQLRPDLEDILLDEFRIAAGSFLCRDIIKQRRLSCAGCVQLAEEFLVDYLESVQPIEKARQWVGFEQTSSH